MQVDGRAARKFVLQAAEDGARRRSYEQNGKVVRRNNVASPSSDEGKPCRFEE